jgi:hypothetical protein
MGPKARTPRHTPEQLALWVEYNPETGALTWKPESRRSGPAFNSKHNARYRYGMIEREIYYSHRVAWAIYYGEWPQGEIDHINGVRDDNRIQNLRDTTRQGQQLNRHIPANNTSGVMGVTWHNPSQSWHVTLTINNQVIHGGYFKDLAQAAKRRRVLEFWHGTGPTHGTRRDALKDVL